MKEMEKKKKKKKERGLAAWVRAEAPPDPLRSGSRGSPCSSSGTAEAMPWLLFCWGPQRPLCGGWLPGLISGGAVRGRGGAAAPCAGPRCPVRPSQHAQRHKQRHEARCSSARCQLLSQPSAHTRLPGGPRLRAPREWGSRTPVPQAAPLLRPAAGCRCSLRAAEPKLAVSGVRG